MDYCHQTYGLIQDFIAENVSQSELFINNGEVVMSNLLFPEDFYKVKLFATGGDLVIEKSIIYEMDEIMNHPLDGDLI